MRDIVRRVYHPTGRRPFVTGDPVIIGHHMRAVVISEEFIRVTDSGWEITVVQVAWDDSVKVFEHHPRRRVWSVNALRHAVRR